VTAAPAPDAPPSLAWPRGSLIVCGVAYLLLALAGGPLIGGSLWFDPDGTNELEVVAMLGVAALWFVVSGAVAAANFVLAWGLGAGRRWAWWGSLFLGAIYAASICLPFGLLILIPLWKPSVKRHFGV
jgi:hypothetical protein